MSLYAGITLPGHPDPANIQALDQLPVPMARQMMKYGMALDLPYLADFSSRLTREMREIRLEIASHIPVSKLDEFIARSGIDADEIEDVDDWAPINVGSGDQLSILLFDVLGVGTEWLKAEKGRELKRTKGGGRVSVAKKQLEQLKREHLVVQYCLDYAERAKLKGTYADKLPRMARLHRAGADCVLCGRHHYEDVWRVHCDILLTRTATGRLAQKNPNLQNVPARTDLGRLLRAAFIAEKGFRLVDRDFSQFELRLLAHCSQDAEMIRVFRAGLDIHLNTAIGIFGLAEEDVDKLLHRAPSKNANFAIVYGITEDGLYDLMALTYATAKKEMPKSMTIDWCGKFLVDWFGIYPEVKPYMEMQHTRAREHGIVWTLFGGVRPVPESRSYLSWIREAGERQAGNVPIQGTQADCMRLTMGETGEELNRWRVDNEVEVYPINTIHDELIVEAEEDFADVCNFRLGEIMDSVLTDRATGRNLCRVPIVSEGKVTQRWEKG